MEISTAAYIGIISLLVFVPHLLRVVSSKSLTHDIFARCLVAPLIIFWIWKTYSTGRFYSYILIVGELGTISLIGFVGLIVFLVSYALSFK